MIIDAARSIPITDEIRRRGGLGLKRVGAEYVGPCPQCGGHDRFGVNTRKGLFLCRGCGAKGDVIAFVQHVDRVSFGDAIRLLTNTDRISAPAPKAKSAQRIAKEAERQAHAMALWNTAQPILGTLAQKYLYLRGLDELPGDDVLRFHPDCPFGDDRLPAMVALYTDIRTNAPKAISRTALAPDGTGIKRLSLGPTTGGAVKLTPDEDVSIGLAIGEGVETTLAAIQLGIRPGWALGSAGAIRTFPILAGIEALTIVVDADKPDARGRQAGQEAAAECMKRWVAAGREVHRLVPKRLGTDFNDCLAEVRHGAV